MSKPASCLIFIALNFFVSISSGQTKKEMKIKFFEAEMYLLYEEYPEALPLYLELEEYSPENINYKYRVGICFLNSPGEKEKALPYLQQAVLNINPKYKEGRFGEQMAPYDAYFYLGDAYRVTNQLDKAIETYKVFLEGLDNRLYDSTIVKNQIDACYNAKKLMSAPLYLRQVNLGDMINERFSEINPVVSGAENAILFTRELQLQDQIFFSRKVNGVWTPPIVIMDQLLVDEGNTTSLSNDGTELFLYQSDQYIGNIYSSRYVDGRWQPAVKLNDNINTKYWESHAVISPNGQRLYFTSNRKGSYGGLDIYYSDRDSTGNWGPAINMGPTINTPFNEETPFLDDSGRILYFSSRGHFNMGGHDIFYSSILENGEWSVPVNMGYPVNSTDDDTFFSPVGEGYVAYMSKFDSDGFGRRDLFRLEIFSDDHPRRFFVRGMVTLRDLIRQFNDSVRISALDRSNLDTLLVIYSDPFTGEYEFEIPHGEYKVIYEADGTEKRTTDLDLKLTHPVDEILMPETRLPKSDFVADFELPEIDNSTVFIAGDSTRLRLLLEPNSILTVEHWLGDSLISRQEFIVNETPFNYPMLPLTGDNKYIFTLQDRFNNITTEEYFVNVPEPIITQPVTEPFDPSVLLAKEVPADITRGVKAGQVTETGETEVRDMDKVVTEVTDVGDSQLLKDAVQKTREKNIKNAGEWLGSLYSVALEDGAEKELLATLIAAISANKEDNAAEYLKRLYGIAGENLRKAIDSIDIREINARVPEDIINLLLGNSDKYGYSQDEVFVAFARMINEREKTAEEIVDYIRKSERGKLWVLWLVLGAGFAAFFIILYRRKRE